MRKLSIISFFAFLFVVTGAMPGIAQEHREWRHDHPHGYDWEHWHRGGWINGWHEGRFGWWWVIDGAWFSYPAPVYPYPEPPVVVVQPAPQHAAPGNYYYCANPSGYYPTVRCSTTSGPLRLCQTPAKILILAGVLGDEHSSFVIVIYNSI
jgi:hypothetical protein